MEELRKELAMLAGSLIKRMRLDLTSDAEENDEGLYSGRAECFDKKDHGTPRRWIAYPQTLRLTTRPRPPLNPDGTRSRTFNRISRSCNMPSMIFSLANNVEVLAEKLVADTLIFLFRKLHPERSGWNLSLVNLCATNMALVAADNKAGVGRDIEKMFRKQDDVLKEWRVEDEDIAPSHSHSGAQQIGKNATTSREHKTTMSILQSHHSYGSEDIRFSTQESYKTDDAWDSEDNGLDLGDACRVCGAVMPPFAMIAHERFHAMPD